MADHFGVIGFGAASTGELSSIVTGMLEKGGGELPCASGYYHRLHSAAGPELWIHMQQLDSTEPDGAPYAIAGITPFFEGEGRAPLRVRACCHRPGDNPFEGAFYVELGPTIALIDVVDFACHANRAVPFMAIAQIAAFPHELAVYESEAAFDATQADRPVKITTRSFLASSLFTSGPEGLVFLDPEAPDFAAPSHAFLTGVVQKAERRRNPETGQEFTWALIATAGGTFDLVVSDAILPQALAPGMVVEGEFWLCGRLT
jgi:hypothetical protein